MDIINEVEDMKILTWNCGGKFREKYKYIETYNCDILVIQECESKSKLELYNQSIFDNYNIEWINNGSTRTDKGLGIFIKKSIRFEKQNWDTFGLNYYLPLKIENKFDLIGLWTEGPGYIRDAYVFLQMYKKLYSNKSEKVLFCGDFNSFVKTKYKSVTKNIESFVKELNELNIKSCYHETYNEKLGNESTFTFLFNNGKMYHIDYIFTNMNYSDFFIVNLSDNNINDKRISDHTPIIVNVSMHL